jgi:hypothetical protein
MPGEICTCTSTGTASIPAKANVRTRAMPAAEECAFTTPVWGVLVNRA